MELQLRALKQTYGRTKLRSRTSEHAYIELHWSLLGLTMLQLLAVKEQSRAGEPAAKTSSAAVLRVIRSMIAEQSATRPQSAALGQRLRQATTDAYHGRARKKVAPIHVEKRNHAQAAHLSRTPPQSTKRPCKRWETTNGRHKMLNGVG